MGATVRRSDAYEGFEQVDIWQVTDDHVLIDLQTGLHVCMKRYQYR
jgi:hypothetical protein